MTLDLATLRLRGTTLSARLTDAVTSMTFDAGEGSIPVLTPTVLDAGRELLNSGLLVKGTAATWRGETWITGRTQTAWTDDDRVVHTITFRSELSKQLRSEYKASVESNVGPDEWVASRVAAAGGVAVCQATSKQGTIAQSSGDQRQSELDVIASLGGPLGYTWVSWGKTLWFGSRYWAWQGKATGQRLWNVARVASRASDEAIAADLAVDDDDTDNLGTGTVTLPYEVGVKVRPWDRFQLSGFGDYSGTWLCTHIGFPADGHTPIVVDVAIPRQPAPKSGSST